MSEVGKKVRAETEELPLMLSRISHAQPDTQWNAGKLRIYVMYSDFFLLLQFVRSMKCTYKFIQIT
jgi:hypothetical protein